MKQTWCIPRLDSHFLARMEELLWLYSQDYDAHYPVVCFDERPCFLIGDVLSPLSMEEGQVKREHYLYSKHGSCCLLAAIEPLTAKRVFRMEARRTKEEYAYFLRDLAREYPQAHKIRLVQDNLNTHSMGALYDFFPAAQARDLAQRFEFYFTPKGASWLNMIEIEFSAVSRLCLNRRIPCMAEMAREVEAFRVSREKQGVKINWQFSLQTARTKLARHYNKVNPKNPNNYFPNHPWHGRLLLGGDAKLTPARRPEPPYAIIYFTDYYTNPRNYLPSSRVDRIQETGRQPDVDGDR